MSILDLRLQKKSEDTLYICWAGEEFSKCMASKLWCGTTAEKIVEDIQGKCEIYNY